MIYSREEILAARAEMPQAWKRTARWRMGSEIDTVKTSEAVGLSNGGFDWSSQTALGASFADFDQKALNFARTQLEQRLGDRAVRLRGMDMESLMTKMGAMVNGVPTHGALLLLGKASSDAHMAGLAPRIVFTRYNEKGQPLQKINVRMPYAMGIQRLVEGICQTGDYPETAVRELIVNAVAHCDYLKRENIEITDFEGQLTVTNPGSWGKGTPVAALRKDYDPTPMRNAALCRLMAQCSIMDAMGLGVQFTQSFLRGEGLPQVSYDLDDGERVSAMLHASHEAAEHPHPLPKAASHPAADQKDGPTDERAANADSPAAGDAAPSGETERAADGRPAAGNAPDSAPATPAKRTAAHTARSSSPTRSAASGSRSSDELKELIVAIVEEGHGMTRAEVVEELNDRGVDGEGERFARRIGRLLDSLHRTGRIRKGVPDNRHWYSA
ncbi:MAG: ATP-binding protein [Eggerthellaceae bacterium]|jgi:hypothetical protein